MQCLPRSRHPASGIYFITKENEVLFLARLLSDKKRQFKQQLKLDELITNAQARGVLSGDIKQILDRLIEVPQPTHDGEQSPISQLTLS